MRLSSELKVLFGNSDFEGMKALPAKPVFSDDICVFLNKLSSEIMRSREAKRFPDVVTFGFFCRKANIAQLKEQYYEQSRLGRGLSFHIAPSNVPINFAYTMVGGLLAGNSCVVRASSKNFEQILLLCELMKKASDNTDVEEYISVVQYGREKNINDYFSAICDVRVIWGGDNTINEIKKSPIPSRAVDVCFADRYSLCVLDAKDVLDISDWNRVAQDFYNDTYLYDQNACSSPRLMYWLGTDEDIDKAKTVFWKNIHDFIARKYTIEPVIAVDKLTMDYRVAIEKEFVKLEPKADNLINRITTPNLEMDLSKYTCPGGSFIEYGSSTLNELKNAVNKKFQTLSYLGGDPQVYRSFVIDNGLSGIDRIVPVGKTADFTMTWDGFDLIKTMSRKVDLR